MKGCSELDMDAKYPDTSDPKHMVIPLSGALEPWEYALLSRYVHLVVQKIEKGRKEYGMDYLTRPDASFRQNIDEELADLSGWSAMRFIKMHRGE